MSIYSKTLMEPYTHYLMWMKSRHDNVMSSIDNKRNNNSSWEEEAFAYDKAGGGGLGGFAWPQRSYVCSFCKREFRSAQALGGHMNVHRRDRAKLKQSLITCPSATTQALLHHHDLNLSSSTTTASFVAPPASSFHFSPPKLYSPPCSAKYEEPIMLNQELDCFVGGKSYFGGIDLDEDIVGCKRHKKTTNSSLKKPHVIIDKYGLQSERLKSFNMVSPIMEDIELELRLGDPPAMK